MTKRALFFSCLFLFSPLGADLTLGQQEGTTPSVADEGGGVAASDVQTFLGYWMLQAKLGDRDVKMGLHFQGRRGFAARLVSFFGELDGSEFRLEGEDLVFDVSSGFGDFVITSRVDGETLVGTLSNGDGSLTAEFSGTKSDRVSFQLFLVPDNETRITREEAMVRIRFAMPPYGERDFQQIEALQPGQVVRFLEDPVIKLITDFPLRVGSLDVPVANITADYPGVYGLWLKRTEVGWSLVFNHKADVWGTQYDPEADHGSVPLEMDQVSEPSETLVAKLEELEDGGLLSLVWGPHRWTAPFQILGPNP